MKAKHFLAILIVFFATTQLLAQSSPSIMTNATVIKLVKSGLENDIIITTIESAAGKFDVSPDELVSLKAAGVPAPVIKSMIASMQGNKAPKNAGKSSSSMADAPTKSGIPEPELINAIYAYSKSAGRLRSLEKANGVQKVRKQSLLATSYTCEIPNDKSTVRLSQDEASSFAVNTGGSSPEAFTLYKAEIKKGKRIAVTSKVSGMGAMKGAQGKIDFQLKMLKAGIYEILPSGRLDPGEYFFMTKAVDYTSMANMDVYAFGID